MVLTVLRFVHVMCVKFLLKFARGIVINLAFHGNYPSVLNNDSKSWTTV